MDIRYYGLKMHHNTPQTINYFEISPLCAAPQYIALDLLHTSLIFAPSPLAKISGYDETLICFS